MPSILLTITRVEQLFPAIEIGHSMARSMDSNLLISTYNDNNFLIRKACEKKLGKQSIQGSEQDLSLTINQFLKRPDTDIIFIIHPYAGEFEKKHKLKKFFRQCQNFIIPYLILPKKLAANWQPENIIFPLSLKSGEKEASAWAGYFSRYTNGKLTLYHPEFRDPYTQKRLWSLLVFIQKLFEKSKISFSHKITGNTTKETKAEILSTASTVINTLIIAPASPITFPDYLFPGLFNFDLIQKQTTTPVLFINPRHDLYVPCG